MEQTISINLAGLVFHIDKPAYEVLEQYLTDIRAQLATTLDPEDTLQDVESRVAELFEQRLSSRKEVISQSDVEAIKAEIGAPASFGSDQAQEQAHQQTQEEPEPDKTEPNMESILRKPGNAYLGGVCEGIGEYYHFQPVWLRLAFIIGVLFFGTGILIYLALWILLPAKKKPELASGSSGQAFSTGSGSSGKRAWRNSKYILTNILAAVEQGLTKLLNACRRAAARLQQT
jgi:phage shock protein PspC (stress-responsive transcriptional regulator)